MLRVSEKLVSLILTGLQVATCLVLVSFRVLIIALDLLVFNLIISNPWEEICNLLMIASIITRVILSMIQSNHNCSNFT